nr:putative ribonuclease H-like domain-containing protein [Tanacetum cinerariifolium]
TEVPEGSENTNPTASASNPPADHMETLTVESPIPTVSSPVPTAYSTDSQEPSSDARLISKRVANQEETPSLNNILSLTNRFEDILGGTTNLDESNEEEDDISNIETVIISSPTPTLRIYKDHPKSQINYPVDTLIQTRNKSKENVWTLVNCPKGIRPIGTKWVLKNKKDERGIVIRNKARLVAQGYTQEEGIDYDEVYAPIARIKAIRLFLAFASFMGFTVYQIDMKSAFLYGTVDKEVYVIQPPGFQDPEFLAKVYKVEKVMYGLHQAPRAWYGTLSKYLLKNGFQTGTIDQTLLIRKQREDFILVQVYVDDIILGSSNRQLFKRIFRYLKGHPKLGLWYPKESPFDLVSFSDSYYGGATQDRKSTTGGCQLLGRRLISWQCKKQTIVATSTTKAEYVAAASCCGQVLWIQNQLLDYGYNFMNTKIYIDNNSAISGSRDRPPMLTTGRYAQWQSCFLRYIDTRPNGNALRKCILQGPYIPTTVIIPAKEATDDSPVVLERTTVETLLNMSPKYKEHYRSEKEAIHL